MPKLMNLYKYMGDRSYSFNGSQGNLVCGTSLFVAYEEQERNVRGLCTDKLNLRPEVELPANIKTGDNLVIQFDRRGKVISVAKAN